MSEKETPVTAKGMPRVSETTVRSIFQAHTKGSEKWGEHLEEVKARLIKEQPALVEFLESQVNKYPPEMHIPIFEVVVATYAVLEQQANSNKISATFSLGSEDKG